MLSNILIALGFMGTGILVGLAIAAWITMGDNKKSETQLDLLVEIRFTCIH
jgi:hypothetical protein